MDFFSILTLIGGLALFLYGMNAMGDGLAKVSGGKLEKILENLTSSPIKAVLAGSGSNCSYPVVIGYDSYGSWFCKLRNYETVPGSRRDHGCKYRYYGHILDLKSDRYPE